MRPPQGRSAAGSGRGGSRRPRDTARPGDRRMGRSAAVREVRRQRLAWALIGGILIVVAGILSYAYYANFIAPPRAQAAKVRDTVYTQGDLVKRLRLINATTGSVDLGRAPWEILFGMVEAELIRQGAEFEGVVVTDEDVDAALRVNFYPQAPEDQEVEPGQLDTEYQERYQSFLTQAQIKDEEYRVLVSDQVYRVALREALGERIPEHFEHANVSWILVPHDAPDPENPPPTPTDILERLRTEEFADVAIDIGGGSGPQGWVPKGVFPELDETLFGADPPEPLTQDEFTGPIVGEDAVYFVQSLSEVEVRPVEERWANAMGPGAPAETEHMDVSWIALPNETSGSESPPPTAEEVLQRLEAEDFADVAMEIGGDSGPQGWLPKGAYPDLDVAIFGPQPLAQSEVSRPITGQNATYIVTVLSDVDVRPLDDDWLPGLKEQALQKWIQDQWALGRLEGWVEIHTDSEQYRWVVEQYNKSVREEQEEAQGQGN